MADLTGRVAIVTGGSSGIGLATVRRLRDDGAVVVAADLNPPPDDDSAVLHVTADLATRAGCERLVEAALKTHDRLDIVVNNVGLAPTRSSFEAIEDSAWEALFEVNVMSAVRTTRAALPALRRSPGASIVMVGSTTARMPDPYWVDYAGTKAALLAIARALAEELGPDRIRVNTVAPGAIRTPLWDRPGGFSEVLAQRYGLPVEEAISRYVREERRITLGTPGRPEDVAATISFLVSNDAAYVTGAEFSVHGGVIKTI